MKIITGYRIQFRITVSFRKVLGPSIDCILLLLVAAFILLVVLLMYSYPGHRMFVFDIGMPYLANECPAMNHEAICQDTDLDR